jgi:hypothetical protein
MIFFLDNGVVGVYLSGKHFNASLGPIYCDHEYPDFEKCVHGTAANISLVVPISAQLADGQLALSFRFEIH